MRVSIWYRTEERNPDVSGAYLCYRGFGIGGMADGDHEHGYCYYNAKTKEWYQYQNDRYSIFVYYWTDATPDDWTDSDPPRNKINDRVFHPSLVEAWADVEKAIERFKIVKGLVE